MKSHNVEDAVLEVIDLLCGDIIGANADDNAPVQYSNLGLELEGEESEGKNRENRRWIPMIDFRGYYGTEIGAKWESSTNEYS